jgi:hypothetical protein
LLNPPTVTCESEHVADCTVPVDIKLFTPEDINLAVTKLKANKALGNCNISSEIFKALGTNAFNEFMCEFFNMLVTMGLPSCWNVL